MNKKLLLYLSFIYLFFSCDPADNKLKIINNLKTNLYFYYSKDTTLTDLKIVRNGYYKNRTGDSTYIQSSYYINNLDSVSVLKRGYKSWNKFLNDNENLNIFYFIDTTVNKYSDSIIIKHNLYYKHKSYSKYELEKSNWKLIIN